MAYHTDFSQCQKRRQIRCNSEDDQSTKQFRRRRDQSQKKLRLKSTCRQVGALAETALKKKSPSLVSPIVFGGFNFEQDSSDVIIRLPCPDLVQFPEQKTLYEAVAMAYLAQYTTIAIPTLFHHTSSSDVRPTLVLQHIESARDMSDALAIPNQDPEETPSPNQEGDIIAAIGWEFTYVAPEQFSLDPPWWLLLEAPEMWSKGIDDWAETYNERLDTWLLVLEDTEKSANGKSEYKLSSYMRESWSSGRFWLNYAARKSWAFDTIYWKFFGPGEAVDKDSYWKIRVKFLGEEGKRKTDSLCKERWRRQKIVS
ncbi:unnamed protein product [Fusarium venenatum]|uniref:Aminoglycoside phosphotransferase domain-containing protein n=1 Tax=Fusarium venenatum TaxID=56646 RepID=A0A2L2TQ51_9HYPO|nr:uncharacterized protein FVRRES_08088 [Fusarium venenatum]CEI68011.1 unnamed protein product [Fusarium venenatum]